MSTREIALANHMTAVGEDNDGVISDLAPAGPIFGRDKEIDDFLQLISDPARSSITLVGGDAGIGKTRLLQAVGDGCRASGGVVLVGRCLDLGDSAAPYLAVTDIVRAARALPAASELTGLDGVTMSDGLRPLEFFEAVADLVEQLGNLAPALIVVEDVHWADRSMRDLLTYLLTRGVTPGVHLAMTYRTDDLHRRHPLRPSLAEWSRLPQVRRLSLDPLDTDPARNLVRHLRPDLAEGTAAVIVRRAGGNPFFTEELVAASVSCEDEEGPLLPPDLAGLLLVRTDGLDDDTRSVLRAVSVVGSAASEETLADLTGLPVGALQAALRAAVDAHLLVPARSGQYDFRHALLAEATYDDLLPGERIRLHDRRTDILLARGGPGTAAPIAMHAERAGRFGDSVRARIAAGQEAMDAAAPANAARHFESAIALAAAHPDTASVAANLSQLAAEALLAAGEPHRAAALIRGDLRGHDGTLLDRARLLRLYLSALLMTDLPTMQVRLGAPGLPDEADELLDLAITWAREGGDDILLGRLVALKAHYLLAFGRYDEAAVSAGDALTIGRAVDDPAITTDAMTTQAKLDGISGDMTSALSVLEQVRQKAASDGDIRAELRALHQMAGLQVRVEQYALAEATYERAIQRATEARARTELYGIDSVVYAAVIAAKLGKWAHVDELLSNTADLPVLARATATAALTAVDVARGRPQAVPASHESLRSHWTEDMFVVVNDAPAVIEVLGDRGDLAGAVAVYDEATATVRSVWRLPVFDAQIRMTALLLTHLADATAGKPRLSAEWAERATQLEAILDAVMLLRRRREALGLESRAWYARARAEVMRLSGDIPEAVAEYREAVRLFAQLEFPYERAAAEVLLSRALHADGRSEEARQVSGQALETAHRLGSARLIAQLRSTRAFDDDDRISTLTPREREVLNLVASGMTNGQVASRLFISTKTASVHVSNILAKLGATNRTEAVDLARRQGLLG